MSTDKDSTADLPRKIESIHRSPFVPPRWLVYTLLTLLLWGGWGLVSKPVAEKLSPWQLQSLSTIGLLPTALLGFSKNLRTGANVRRAFLFAFGSGVIASLGNIAYYAALASGGKAADVTPLTALYPLVTIALAIVFLRERLNVFQAVGVVASLAALYVFNVGSHSAWFTPWLALALIPIALWGVSALLQKCSVMHGSSELVTVGFLLGALPISLLLPFWVEMKWTLPVSTWAPALAVGLLFGLGNLTLIFAYATGGKASVVTPMSSVYSIVTIPLAVLLLGERLTGRETLGIALALGAAVALSYESQRAGSKSR
jgi:uncharacterized membrane protein